MKIKLKIDREKLVKKLSNFIYWLAENAFLVLIFLFALSILFSAILFFKFEKEKNKIVPQEETTLLKKQLNQALDLLEKKQR